VVVVVAPAVRTGRARRSDALWQHMHDNGEHEGAAWGLLAANSLLVATAAVIRKSI